MNLDSQVYRLFYGADAGETLPASAMLDEPELAPDYHVQPGETIEVYTLDGLPRTLVCTRRNLRVYDYVIRGENYRLTEIAHKPALYVGTQLVAMGDDAETLADAISLEWAAITRRTPWRAEAASVEAERRRAEYFERLERIVQEGEKFLADPHDYAEEMDARYFGDFTYTTVTEAIDDALRQLYPEPGQWEYDGMSAVPLSAAI